MFSEKSKNKVKFFQNLFIFFLPIFYCNEKKTSNNTKLRFLNNLLLFFFLPKKDKMLFLFPRCVGEKNFPSEQCNNIPRTSSIFFSSKIYLLINNVKWHYIAYFHWTNMVSILKLYFKQRSSDCNIKEKLIIKDIFHSVMFALNGCHYK